VLNISHFKLAARFSGVNEITIWTSELVYATVFMYVAILNTSLYEDVTEKLSYTYKRLHLKCPLFLSNFNEI